MRIGVNLHQLLPHAGGIAQYALTFLREWTARYPEHPLVPFTFDANEPMLGALPAAARQAERRLRSPSEIGRYANDLDVYFCPFGILAPRPFPKPSVVLVVDMQECFFPEFFSRRDRRARAFQYRWSMRMADRVVAISEFSRRSFVELAGIPDQKISTIPLCPPPFPQPARPAALPSSFPSAFALYPANTWPHKNHRRLLGAIRRLKDSGLVIPCVLTGTAIPGTSPLDDLIAESGLSGQVVYLGQVGRAELAWLFRHARLLVFPSLFEGFGLPLAEAMPAGVPIVCSNTSSLPEVAGEAALYFNPGDETDMAQALRVGWSDEDRRARLAQAGRQRAGRFTPDRMMDDHLQAFQQAIVDFPARPGRMAQWLQAAWSQGSRARFWISRRERLRAQALLAHCAAG
jgi:glycosyltransferase involved in cell wall biosynthesis